jgi:tagatose 1,6-diphosphate aldolase
MPRRIVSGGQSGADRAALDVARELGLAAGGWVPRGRLAEDGPIPARYAGLREAASADPAERTALNVRDSDATLLVSHGPLRGGSLLTWQEAHRLGRPVLHLDLGALGLAEATTRLREWLHAVAPDTLNVAGPRASEDAAIGERVAALLRAALPAQGGAPDLPADDLCDGVLALVLRELTPADRVRGWVPAWHFTMILPGSGEPVGLLSLRVGRTEWLERYAGQVGYAVAALHRGRRYAMRALRLVAPLAWRHGLVPLWITCNPDNVASRRTCELAGAEWVETLPLPPGNEMYARGDRFKCRYRLLPPGGEPR